MFTLILDDEMIPHLAAWIRDSTSDAMITRLKKKTDKEVCELAVQQITDKMVEEFLVQKFPRNPKFLLKSTQPHVNGLYGHENDTKLHHQE